MYFWFHRERSDTRGQVAQGAQVLIEGTAEHPVRTEGGLSNWSRARSSTIYWIGSSITQSSTSLDPVEKRPCVVAGLSLRSLYAKILVRTR
jgi:hypothetical protein